MSSSVGLKLCYMCGYVGMKGVGLEKRWGQQLVGNGVVDFQQRTSGVRFAPSMKATIPSKGFFAF